MSNMRKLGSRQEKILKSLIEYKGWQKRCGWVYSTEGEMLRVLNSLLKSGYVNKYKEFYYAIKGVDGESLTHEQNRRIEDALNGEKNKAA